MITSFLKRVDWFMLLYALLIVLAGLITMHAFTGDDQFFSHQIGWLVVSVILYVFISQIDAQYLKNPRVLLSLYGATIVLLLLVLVIGSVSNGARSWFRFGFISFQPSDLAKLALVLILAKYFSRRHVEIAHIKHILISGMYAVVPFLLIFLQPDFGSAIILFFIWFGMTLVSGISKRHLLLVGAIGLLSFSLLWFFIFKPYQKDRIRTFINPLTDIHGAGYNAYQSTIAVGSGQLLGKGVGYGTQSRLKFLPEYQTDFIFAAFAEEWGFIGVFLLLAFFTVLISRIVKYALRGATNFEILFCVGVIIWFGSHVIINVGMNVGIMPVTGITLPLMSYGGSHLVAEFCALGIISAMAAYRRVAHRDDYTKEFLGI